MNPKDFFGKCLNNDQMDFHEILDKHVVKMLMGLLYSSPNNGTNIKKV